MIFAIIFFEDEWVFVGDGLQVMQYLFSINV